jgi:GT2 family glycosyltransferase
VTATPNVSVVVLNYNGRKHLEPCFRSLQRLDYPEEALELILVDNASSDGSVELTRTRFPDVRVVTNEENLGFAAGNNVGAVAATGDYVVFLNNDMTVEPGFLRGLVDVLGDRRVCAGAKILDWSGSRVDFAGAAAHFAGYAYQEGFRKPAHRYADQKPAPSLFACGGAMLIERKVFLEVGGFDEDYFIYYEDLDLGWRLWVLGYEVWYAPEAVVHHRHHGTMDGFADARKRVLYTRNALASAFKNYGDENVGGVFSAALLGTLAGIVERSGRRSLLDAPDFEFFSQASPAGPDVALEIGDASALVGLHELALMLPRLAERRRAIQSARQRPDEEIMPLFRWPFLHWPGVDGWTQGRLAEGFGLLRLFESVPRRILVVEPGLGRGNAICAVFERSGHEVTTVRASRDGRELFAALEATDPQAVVVCDSSALGVLTRTRLAIPVVLDQADTPRAANGRTFPSLRHVDRVTCEDAAVAASATAAARRAGWAESELETITIDPLKAERPPIVAFAVAAGLRRATGAPAGEDPTLVAKAIDAYRRGGITMVVRKSAALALRTVRRTPA